MSYINVPVPEEHVPAVYALLAGLQEGHEAPATPSGRAGRTEDLIRRAYVESQDTHRRLMEYLAERSDDWTYSSELAKGLGLSSGSRSVAGMFGAFGRRAKHRYGGVKPWDLRWDSARGEAAYRVEPDVAGWIKDAAASGV